MPRFVRKLDQATWWDTEEGQDPDTLGSDSLKNAKSTRNELSVYQVDSDEELRLVLATLAAKRDNLAHIDFCTFDDQVLERSQVEIRVNNGSTGCSQVDALHRDLVALTAPSLARFVCHAAASGNVDSWGKDEVIGLIRRFKGEGLLGLEIINSKIRSSFEA